MGEIRDDAFDDELAHLHTCPGCGAPRACRVMLCRDPAYARPCWACVKAGRAAA